MFDATRLRSAVLAVPLAAAALFAATPAEAAPAGPLTCRGQGIDPAAQVHHRTETFVKAPLAAVWKVHTGLEAWPTWQSAVTGVRRLDPGSLHPGSRFRWTTPAPATPSSPATTLAITSTVGQVRHDRCIRWTGPAIGEGLRIDRGVHVWTFTPAAGGVVVRTEESWTGGQIEADPAMALKYLAPGLDRWLADLKTAAEARPC